MEIQQIIFNVLDSPHVWVKYWKDAKDAVIPKEHVIIRGHFITTNQFLALLANGFQIDTVRSIKIGADAYCDVSFERPIK